MRRHKAKVATDDPVWLHFIAAEASTVTWEFGVKEKTAKKRMSAYVIKCIESSVD